MFVSFEGCEGVGKSTQLKLLKDYLESTNQRAVYVREPGSTHISEQIRKLDIIIDDIEIAIDKRGHRRKERTAIRWLPHRNAITQIIEYLEIRIIHSSHVADMSCFNVEILHSRDSLRNSTFRRYHIALGVRPGIHKLVQWICFHLLTCTRIRYKHFDIIRIGSV